MYTRLALIVPLTLSRSSKMQGVTSGPHVPGTGFYSQPWGHLLWARERGGKVT